MKGQKKLFKQRKHKFIKYGYDNYDEDVKYWKYVMSKRTTVCAALNEMYYYGLF